MSATRVDVIVNSLGIGGAERHSLTLANAMVDQGFAVRVISLAVAEGSHRQNTTAATSKAIQLHRRGPIDLRALRAYRSLVKSDRPDLTITVNDYPLAFAWAATLWSHRPAMLQITHTIELPHEDNRVKRWLYPQLLRVPAAVVYVCDLQRQHWRRAGIRARADHCVHNGIDVDRFRPLSSATVIAARAALGFSPDDFVVGICAVLRPEKRHDLLLQALALLWRRGDRVQALLIGDGPERAHIEARARALKIDHAVHITGYQQDVVPLIGAADVMCLVSDYETFSLSILEAMAMAKAVIATRAGAVEEQIAHTENGLLVERGNAGELAEAITQLRDAGYRATIGQRALATVRSQFTEAEMVAHYVRIVQQLASKQPTLRRTP
ncbi:MAG: glycosyltransferase family 4 protein [Rhizobacter sp.]